MRAFIVSYNRPDSHATAGVLEALGCDVTVIVHNEAQAAAYVRGGRIPPNAELVVSGVTPGPGGKTRQVRFASALAAPKEWHIFADDDIRELSAHPAAFTEQEKLERSLDQNLERKQFRTPITTSADFRALYTRQITRAHDIGARLIGGSQYEDPNPWFMQKRWNYTGLIVGVYTLRLNTPFDWDPSVDSMEDYRNTAEHLLQHGRVLRDRWVSFRTYYYASGGMGPHVERAFRMQTDVARLCWQYAGLFAPHSRPGFVPNTQIRFRLTRPEQIDRWRATLLMPEVLHG